MGDIVRAHGAALRAACVLTPTQHAVIDALARCRTRRLQRVWTCHARLQLLSQSPLSDLPVP